jgi:hypothetical protein
VETLNPLQEAAVSRFFNQFWSNILLFKAWLVDKKSHLYAYTLFLAQKEQN